MPGFPRYAIRVQRVNSRTARKIHEIATPQTAISCCYKGHQLAKLICLWNNVFSYFGLNSGSKYKHGPYSNRKDRSIAGLTKHLEFGGIHITTICMYTCYTGIWRTR